MRSEEVVRLASANLQSTQAAWITKGTSALLWVAVVAGPVTGGVALANTPTEPQPPNEKSASPQVRDGTGPSEYALRTVAAWVAGADITTDSTTGAENPSESGEGRRAADLRVAHVTEPRPGIWAITISGRIAETGDRSSGEAERAGRETNNDTSNRSRSSQRQDNSGGDADDSGEQVSGLRYWRVAVAAKGSAAGTSD